MSILEQLTGSGILHLMHHRIGFKQIIAIIGIGCVAAAFVPANRAVAQDPVAMSTAKSTNYAVLRG